ncbi:hypothetical protein DKX38_021248 [Salix brachista]|uniref:Uncharacterized protein n=1 Tax=Salix brachista TaxID=2182728 RepID=A0A5N5K7A4_9ROSI|nr:hypothetical protein DKX38_021248 [Salix brachista]
MCSGCDNPCQPLPSPPPPPPPVSFCPPQPPPAVVSASPPPPSVPSSGTYYYSPPPPNSVPTYAYSPPPPYSVPTYAYSSPPPPAGVGGFYPPPNYAGGDVGGGLQSNFAPLEVRPCALFDWQPEALAPGRYVYGYALARASILFIKELLEREMSLVNESKIAFRGMS